MLCNIPSLSYYRFDSALDRATVGPVAKSQSRWQNLLDAKDTSFFRLDIFFESDIFHPETINCVLGKIRKASRVDLYALMFGVLEIGRCRAKKQHAIAENEYDQMPIVPSIHFRTLFCFSPRLIEDYSNGAQEEDST
jgi:hypothetical protein